MTVSLQALLETHPYKTKACLEHICSALGLSAHGTVVTLRKRIVEHAEDKAKDSVNLDGKIRDMAHNFGQKRNGSMSKTPRGENPKYPLSPVAVLSSAQHSTPIAQVPSSAVTMMGSVVAAAPTHQEQPQHPKLQQQEQPQATQPASQLLFNDSQTILECESKTGDPVVHRQIDELAEMYDELTLNGDEDEEFPGVTEARKRRRIHPLTHINQSLWYDDEVGSSGGKGDGETADDDPMDKAKSYLPEFEKRMKILLEKAIETVASKDSQIEIFEGQLIKVIEVTGKMIEKTDSYMETILSKTEMTSQMVGDLKNEVQRQGTKVTQLEEAIGAREKALQQAQEQIKKSDHEVQVQRSKVAQLEESVRARDQELAQVREQMKHSEQFVSELLKGTTEQLKEVQRKIDGLERKLNEPSIRSRLLSIASSSAPTVPVAPPSSLSPTPPKEAPTSSSLTSSSSSATATAQTSRGVSSMAKSSPLVTNTTKPTPGRTREGPDGDKSGEVVIVITDSNGKHLNPELLHDTKKVVIERRATWEMARDYIPKPSNPASVTDVVLVPGINNVMREDQQISHILQIADATARMYQNAFPKATIHLGSIAPANEKCLNYNLHLQDLAAHRGAPFITIEDMYDRGNGQLKPNSLNGIHYTKVGIRPLAKQMKRSLYRQRTLPMQESHNHQAFPRMGSRPERAQCITHPSQNAAMILETFFNIAKACLPQQ